MRQHRQILLALILGVLLISIWPGTVSQRSVAYAHAFVIGSDPVDGSTVTGAPRVVRIFFDAAISPASIAHVYTPAEQIADAVRSSVSSTNPRELDTPLLAPGQLPQGSYTVRWTAVANDDGHTTHGVIGFNIGQSSTGLPGQTILGPSTSNLPTELNAIGLLSVAWEWLVLAALTFWVGILFTEGCILAGIERAPLLLAETRKRTRPLQWLCLAALLVGEIITLILRASALSQVLNGGGINFVALIQILTETTYGFLWLLRLILIVLAMCLLWWANHRGSRRGGSGAAGESGNLGPLWSPVGGDDVPVRGTGRGRPQGSKVSAPLPTPPQPLQNEGASQVVLKNPTPERGYSVVWLLLAGLILLTLALSGDAAALDQPHISAIVLNWLYLTAQCIWIGGLAYFGYVLLPLLPAAEPDHSSEILTILLRRFHPLMLGAVGVMLVSGLYLAEASLSNAQQLVSDPYGRTLLVEGVLVASMILLSGYAFFMLRPKLTRQAALLPVVNAELPTRRTRQSALGATTHRLKQALSVQSWLGAGVLLCAALMAFFAPPIVFPAIDYTQSTNPVSPPPTSTAFIMQTQQVGALSITLQVLPGRIGYANTVIVLLRDSRSGNPVTDAQVQMSINMELMNMGTAQASIKGGNPTYIATFDKDRAFSMFGVWDIRLTIKRPASAPVEAVYPVMLSGT